MIARLSWWLGVVLAAVLLSACGSHVYHQVRKGDTLYSISWRYHQDYHQVAAWNDISPPFVIHDGQWIRVAPPKSGSSPKKSQVAAASSRPQSAPPKTATGQPAVQAKSPPRSSTQAGRTPPLKPPSEKSKPAPTALVDPSHWRWPVDGPIVHRFNSTAPGKKGIDIAGSRGAPVRAAASGRVVYSGNGLRGYGNLLIVKHSDKYLSAYAHNQKLLVKEGEHVAQGQMIAKMGSSENDRVLLHFEIRVNGKPVDPLHYLPKRGT